MKKKTEKRIKEQKLNVYSLAGRVKKKLKIPELFYEEYRPDLIKRAVKAIQANRRQPYGASPWAGKRHVARWIGKGRGMSRVPRLASGRGSFAPGTVGGRRAHPPKAAKSWHQKINKKERNKAMRAALASTTLKELVSKRGHKFKPQLTLPVILENKFEDLNSSKEVVKVFQKLGIQQDLERAREGTRVRAGRGKLRGRKYRVPKSALIIVSKLGEIEKGLRNLLGVDFATPKSLNVELLAPGSMPGRLTLFTESAFQEVVNKFG